MPYPTLTEYQDAIQNPKTCFFLPELKAAKPELDRFGIPRPFSGNFAVVFPVSYANKKWAVRCFAIELLDREFRYRNIGQYLKIKKLSCMVDFDFIQQGIKVKGNWYPILRMEWVDGIPLNKYVENNLTKPETIIDLGNKFNSMVSELQKCGVAHGDLQHGNILVVNSEIKLVDYDCMFVPGLEGLKSNEVGHKNYQHPKRSAKDFGPHLDNFSTWCIYLSLMALGSEPSLWKLLDAGEENLLFKKQDLESPTNSKTFRILEDLADEKIKIIAENFRKTLNSTDLKLVPRLSTTFSLKPNGDVTSNILKPNEATIGWTDWLPDFLPEIQSVKPLRPSVSEHALFKILLLMTAYLSYSFFFMGIVDKSLLIVLSTGLPSAFAIAAFRFYKSPEQKRKSEFKKLIRQNMIKIKHLKRDSERLTIERDFYQSENNRKISKAEARFVSLNRKKTAEIEKVSIPLKDKISKFKTERQIVDREETDAFNKALREFQKNYIDSKLANHSISSAIISGIGSKLTQELAFNGIKTFADIQDVIVNYVQRGRFTRRIVLIQVKGRGRVNVHGIGPKKGDALLQYKKGLEQKYLNGAPRTLPSHVLDSLCHPFKTKRARLNSEEQNAQQILSQEVNKVRQSYAKQIEDCTKEMLFLKSCLNNNFNELAWKADQANKIFQKQNTEHLYMRERLKIFRKISFSRYIRQALLV